MRLKISSANANHVVPASVCNVSTLRYTIISGKLLISQPSQDREDDGTYECLAGNEYGFILSNAVALTFGCKNGQIIDSEDLRIDVN